MKTDTLDLRCMDCMDLMREFPDKHFDIAIVDPPYGISAPKQADSQWHRNKNRLSQGGGKLNDRVVQPLNLEWDEHPPKQEYFDELRRASKSQIIWGANYFNLPPSRCVIAWDKCQSWESFSAWEMAWTSYDKPAALYRQRTHATGKIHPTQKPVKLYSWLLSKFAKPGQRILDTHLGSGSIAIACHYFGVHLTASEIDRNYFNAACERIQRETLQTTLSL